MKRSKPLRTDPKQQREWQRRSAERAQAKARERSTTRTCKGCGKTFTVPFPSTTNKCCSPGCASKVSSEAKRGAKNPAYRSGQRAGVRDREGERRWYAAAGGSCEAPGCPSPPGTRTARHHVSYRQHVAREGGDEWDPRNGMSLCQSCHASHHQRGRVLPLAALPDAAYAFALDTFGAAAYDYLRRRYAGEDERLTALLAASGANGAAGSTPPPSGD